VVSVAILRKNMKFKIKKPFQIKKPSSATLERWDEWRKEAKKQHPVKYFFSEELTIWFRIKIRRIENYYWKIKYRFIPKHKYHIVDTGLKPEYYDVDTRMLHVCFSLLCCYVEKQLPSCISKFRFKNKLEYSDFIEGLDYMILLNEKEGLNAHVETYKEIKSLYIWWKKDYLVNFDMLEYHEIDSYNEIATENIVRLVKIRGFLWV